MPPKRRKDQARVRAYLRADRTPCHGRSLPPSSLVATPCHGRDALDSVALLAAVTRVLTKVSLSRLPKDAPTSGRNRRPGEARTVDSVEGLQSVARRATVPHVPPFFANFTESAGKRLGACVRPMPQERQKAGHTMGFQKRTKRGRTATFDAATVEAATAKVSAFRKSANVGDALVFSEVAATHALATGGEPDSFRPTMVKALDGDDDARKTVATVRSRITRALDVEGVQVIYGIADDGEASFGVEATKVTKDAPKSTTKTSTKSTKSGTKKSTKNGTKKSTKK